MSQKLENLKVNFAKESLGNMMEECQLPKEWKWVRLGEVCEFGYGSSLPERDRVSGSIPVFGSNGVIGHHNIAITQGSTIIIGRKGSIGQVNYSLNPCWPIDTTYYIDSSKTNCDLVWLFWLLNWLQLGLLNKATGIPGLNRKDAYNQIISLPHLAEQKLIAAKIQRLLQEIERARTACEKQLEAAKALPAAYLREFFESEKAKKWEKKSLGEVCDYDSGIWGDETDDSSLCYPILRSNNIHNGQMIFQEIAIRKINKKYVEMKKLKTGDILVTTSSGSRNLLGKSALFIQPLDGKTYLFSNFTMRLSYKDEIIDSVFLYFYLQSPEAKEILKLLQDTTTGLRNLDRKEFINQMIPLPHLSIQQHIAVELKEKMAEAEKLRKTIEEQLDSINTLPQAILKKAFTGGL